jgi:3''-phosphoadenosine 5''-phosphosulfate sulfotransferase (PAPS reductase)/FAD synthetase and related enzymes
VRRAESNKRAKRNEIELDGHKFSGSIDQFNETQETRIGCINGKERVILNPIIDWSDKEVWEFLNENHIEHCCLYDEGYSRLGCLFCPMGTRKTALRDKARYPKHYKAIIGTITKTQQRILAEKGELKNIWGMPAEDIFDYWISNKSYKKWYADRYQQLKLFEDESKDKEIQ